MGIELVEVLKGVPKQIQAPDSDVILHVPQGVTGVILGKIHTDHWRFNHLVDNMGCFVSPRPEFHFFGNKLPTGLTFTTQISLSVEITKNIARKIQVWNRKSKGTPFQLLPKGPTNNHSEGSAEKYFTINGQSICIHAPDFCDNVVTLKDIHCCSRRAKLMIFSKMSHVLGTPIADVSLRFGGLQYEKSDFFTVRCNRPLSASFT